MNCNNAESEGWSRLLQPRWVLLSLILLALAGIAAYSNSFDVPFTFDDEMAIATNDIIKELSRFSSGQGIHYNPRRILGYLSLALNYRYGTLDVYGYHLVNLVIHIVSSFLVFALAALTLKTPFFRQPLAGAEERLPAGAGLLPIVAALLFVAHPMQTQAVTYVVQRFASLATLFYLAAVLCYAKGRLSMCTASLTAPCDSAAPSRGRLGAAPLVWFALALLMALCALTTKEITVTLPLALVLYECSFFGVSKQKLRRILWGALALGGAALLLVAISSRGNPFPALDAMSRETTEISRWSYFLTQLTVIVRYLGLLILPMDQQVVYDYPLRQSLFSGEVLLCSLLLLLLLALAAWTYRLSARADQGLDPMRSLWVPTAAGRRLLRIVGFGLIWFFLTLSVESGIIPIRDVIFEHRVYLPSAGFFMALAAAVLAYVSLQDLRFFALVALFLVGTLGFFTYQRNEMWRDPVALWRDNAEKAPSNVGAWQNLGVALHRKQDYEGAIKAYQYCLLFKEIDPQIYNNLGAANASAGRLSDAAEMFRTSLRLRPLQWGTWLNLGTLDLMAGQYAAAEEEIKSAQRLAPDRMEVHYHLGDLYERQGRFQEAEAAYRRAVALDPAYSQAWKGLGSVVRAQGRASEGEGYLSRAAAMEKKGGDIYYEIGK